MNRFFVFSFENNAHWTGHKRYFLPTVDIKDYSLMVDERNFLDQPVKNSGRSFDNIRKIRNGRRDNFTTACLLHYPYFEKH